MKKCIISIIILLIVIILKVISISQEDKEIPTVSIPSTNRVIIIDAGHGKPDEGAIGFQGMTEERINLEIALKLQELLESTGTIAILTRHDENGIYDINSKTIRQKKVSDIYNRIDIVNNSNAEFIVSIHLNKFSNSAYRGWQTFFKKNSPDSNMLANHIQNSISKNIEYNNKRIPKQIENIYLMDNSKIPAVIVECGFISNPEEAKLLEKKEYQNKITWGIFIGIQNYFKEKYG